MSGPYARGARAMADLMEAPVKMLWRARGFIYHFPGPVLIMGVVNVTPDSFSDGGQFVHATAAAEYALQLAEEGADIIDIGGESSRPGATPVEADEELRRVMPVLELLAGRLSIAVSIDTVKPVVAREALLAGASIINDIGASHDDGAMAELVRTTGAGYVAMHMQGTPRSMQENPSYQDVVREVDEFFSKQLERLRAASVDKEQVVLDPGIGFGKRPQDNLQLLARLNHFAHLSRPLLVGASRKSFLQRWTDDKNRLAPSLACACWAAQAGAQIIRCHDVAATKAAVRLTEELTAQRCDDEHS